MKDLLLRASVVVRTSKMKISRRPLADYREPTQKDGWNTQDERMTTKCRVGLGMHSLAPHFFVILPS